VLIHNQGRLLAGMELTLVCYLAGVNWVREQCVEMTAREGFAAALAAIRRCAAFRPEPETVGLLLDPGLVTYADDLVILCRRGNAEPALHHLREIMGKLKLTVNEEKTRICKVPEGEFDFLGFRFGRMYSRTTGQARLALRPSKKSIKRMVDKVHALTVRSRTWQETTTLAGELNRALAGWAKLLRCRLFSPSLSRA
jgi:hypothetical protein